MKSIIYPELILLRLLLLHVRLELCLFKASFCDFKDRDIFAGPAPKTAPAVLHPDTHLASARAAEGSVDRGIHGGHQSRVRICRFLLATLFSFFHFRAIRVCLPDSGK